MNGNNAKGNAVGFKLSSINKVTRNIYLFMLYTFNIYNHIVNRHKINK